MTPRSQLQPGQGISRYLTPETWIKSPKTRNRYLCLWFLDEIISLPRCLFIISGWWLIWCYPAFYSADICSFHPWPGHWEARGERGVSSFYWSQVWLLLSAQLSSSEWHRVTQPRTHSHNIHRAQQREILIQGRHQNMQIKLALCICIHHHSLHRHTYFVSSVELLMIMIPRSESLH